MGLKGVYSGVGVCCQMGNPGTKSLQIGVRSPPDLCKLGSQQRGHM